MSEPQITVTPFDLTAIDPCLTIKRWSEPLDVRKVPEDDEKMLALRRQVGRNYAKQITRSY